MSMIVQQLVVILVFSQEGVRARPSTPPSWILLTFPLVAAMRSLTFFNIFYFIYLFILTFYWSIIALQLHVSFCFITK